MARPGSSDGVSPVVDRPWDVQVTIVRAPHPPWERIARASFTTRARVVVASALVVVCLGAVVAAVLRAGSADRISSAAPPRVAAVYRYPLGCLGASLSAGGPVSVALRANTGGPCWRYGVYLTAILVRIHGIWHLGLEAVSRSCPAVSLPASVRAQLVACSRLPRPPTGLRTAGQRWGR